MSVAQGLITRATVRRPRHVVVVTGSRAEYGLMQSTLRAIDADRRLRLSVVATGMHLLRRFGNTVRDIERDGWEIAARVKLQRGDDETLDQARALSRAVERLGRVLVDLRPDVLLLLGDRVETMGAALAAVATDTPLAHIHGGDVAVGDLDERFRHSISKLANLHFAASSRARRRLVRMGERPEHVFNVGAPGLDDLREIRAATTRLRDQAIVLYHASGQPVDHEQRTMTAVLDAVMSRALVPTVIYPNTDRGNRGVIAAIEKFARRLKHARSKLRGAVVRSLPRGEFLARLCAARVLVGNSSAGYIEAPFAGTPTVDIGRRQAGRDRGGKHIYSADVSSASIRAALDEALAVVPRRPVRTMYGTGLSGQAISDTLAEIELTPETLRKKLTY